MFVRNSKLYASGVTELCLWNLAPTLQVDADVVISLVQEFLKYGPKICQAGVPSSPYSTLYDAFVCGTDLPPGPFRALFIEAGLIHILVVSGAHLVFAERLMKALPNIARLFLLTVYGWLTGFGVPVLRALLRRLCQTVFAEWGWTRLQSEAKTTVIMLCLHPQWLSSRSFLMSWTCALALQTPWRLKKWPHLSDSLKCYAFLFPFCPSSPLAIAWNSLAAPLMGELLFPTCLAAFLCPPVAPLTDQVWRAGVWLLEVGPRSPAPQLEWRMSDIWWAPAIVHAALLWGEWKWRRASAFSC